MNTNSKRIQIPLTLLLALGVFFCTGAGRPVSAALGHSNPVRSLVVDKEYLFALRTADEFLIAWLRRDWKKGPEFLSDRLKRELTEQDIQLFFSGLSNPHHQSFEIVGAERLDEKTIRFHVWLYEHYTGTTPPPVKRPAPLVIDVVEVAPDRWQVDRLPK